MNVPNQECAVRVLVLGGGWPSKEAPNEAADVVAYEFVSRLAAQEEFQVSFAIVGESIGDIADPDPVEMTYLASLGVQFLEPVRIDGLPPLSRSALAIRGVLLADPGAFYPGAGSGGSLAPLVARARPDVILTAWSEIATVAGSDTDIPVVAYYGDSMPEVFLANVSYEATQAGGEGTGHFARSLKNWLIYQARSRAEIRILRRLAAVLDVSENVALSYAARGVRRSVYVPCMRSLPEEALDWKEIRDRTEQTSPAKLIASIGSVRGTGNTLALDTLSRKVLPELKRRAAAEGYDFELHIFGRGEPREGLKPLLSQDCFRLRGFVPDLDAEILSAPVFLIPHNYGRFKVAYSRVLHAWSLGSCIIAFKDTQLAMPELEHGVNALLASDPDHMAELVGQALSNRNLRRSLGEGGYNTLRDRMTPDTVVDRVAAELRLAARSRASKTYG